jgi:CheY-like chemotaxis protein
MNTANPKNAARFDKDTYNSRAILVVDDDRQLAEALKFILGEEQMQVDVAYDGEEALNKLRHGKYDAVVCDVVMPRMDGASLHARATELFPGLAEKFVFITGHPEDPKSWEFISGSQSKCLLKPFPIQDLIGVVKKALE